MLLFNATIVHSSKSKIDGSLPHVVVCRLPRLVLYVLLAQYPGFASHAVIPSKDGIQRKTDWMPDQARHDETPSRPCCLRLFFCRQLINGAR
jgi:hypothetical protein